MWVGVAILVILAYAWGKDRQTATEMLTPTYSPVKSHDENRKGRPQTLQRHGVTYMLE
jgi:hypothetical protein